MSADAARADLRIQEFDDAEHCAGALAAALGEALDDALAERGRAGMALSGGRTPARVLPGLFRQARDWHRVTVTYTDDRWVPAGAADSNHGMVRNLAGGTPAAAAAFVPLAGDQETPRETPQETPEAGLDQVRRRLAAVPWPLDAAYLGMGPDGHIASLFPGGGWSEAPGPVVPVPPPDAAATDARGLARISLTPRALLDCRRLFLMLTGADKARVLDRALRPGPAEELPLRLILHQHRVPVRIFKAP